MWSGNSTDLADHELQPPIGPEMPDLTLSVPKMSCRLKSAGSGHSRQAPVYFS